jgi:hypothetical protein
VDSGPAYDHCKNLLTTSTIFLLITQELIHQDLMSVAKGIILRVLMLLYTQKEMCTAPGEKINFSVILRDAQWKNPGDVPLKMKFLMPNGKELRSFAKA